KEHVIPAGLDGNVTLSQASCLCCADITKRFEEHVLRDMWLGFRAQQGLRSRRARTRPLSLALEVRRGQSWSVEWVPITDHLAPAVFPLFVPPVHLTEADYQQGITLIPSAVGTLMDEQWQTLLQRLGADSCRLIQSFSPIDFARLIAKIAYGTAI